MYKFHDTTIRNDCGDGQLPVSAMNYNGMYFEHFVEGYQTLSVVGREMLSLDIQTDSKNIGSHVWNTKLPSREITVNYLLTNRDPKKIMYNFRRLMNYLYTETDVDIFFNDERDVIYKGRYMASDEVPGDTYSFTSSFTILCPNPLKYAYNEIVSDGQITKQFNYNTLPSRIEVTSEFSRDIELKNGDKVITMTNIKQGDKVVFDFDKGQVFVNGKNNTRFLDIKSDFENFYLINNQTITCNHDNIKIYYKEVML